MGKDRSCLSSKYLVPPSPSPSLLLTSLQPSMSLTMEYTGMKISWSEMCSLSHVSVMHNTSGLLIRHSALKQSILEYKLLALPLYYQLQTSRVERIANPCAGQGCLEWSSGRWGEEALVRLISKIFWQCKFRRASLHVAASELAQNFCQACQLMQTPPLQHLDPNTELHSHSNHGWLAKD